MIVDMSPGHRVSPSKGGATWQVTITKSAIPKEKTLAGVCLSLLGASPLVPTDTPPPFSSRLSRCSHLDCRAAAFRPPPVDAFQKHGKLGRRHHHRTGLGRWPNEPASVHPLGEKAHALTVIPEQLYQITALPSKGEQRTGMRALLQNLLRHHSQAVKTLTHICCAAGQEYPR